MLKIAHHTAYIHPLPEGHRFPMLKYELIPAQLVYEGLVQAHNFFEPGLVSLETACLAHAVDYVDALFELTLDARMIRRIGFPLSKSLVDRERYILDGTIQSALFAQAFGVSFNTAGGTHHAGKDFGEGFCLMNDQAVAAAYLYEKGLAERILIIDLDVHQGNGTAHIFANHPDIMTLSVHAEKNYPFVKEKSHFDIGLADGVVDAEYLDLLQEKVTSIMEGVKPDFVFYQAGVDILDTDRLGRFSISAAGISRRDRLVFALCKDRNIPIQVSMGGGYSPDIRDIVNAHIGTYRAAIDIFDF